ncbi:hypothetical protein [Kineococcus sp. SYSU DK002]|uniref:hypothetical protein n=1 Tax=Kineococcus sp. SYSU DK002 TaxID=3383123 RepID=UPI003D7D5FEF
MNDPELDLPADRDAQARYDAHLVRAEPDLPGLATVLDPGLLRAWSGLPQARVDRLRHKPSTSLRAAVDPGDGGPWWLLAAHSPSSWRKAGKDLRAAAGAPVLVEDGLRLVLVPAACDRALPAVRALAARARTVAHNPARRAVLRTAGGATVTKVHADPGTAARSLRAGRALGAVGVRVPPARTDGPHVVRAPWRPGRAATAGDTAAVADLAGRWAHADPTGLPDLGPADLRGAVRRAVAGTPALDEGFTDLLHRTASRWWAVAAGDPALTPAVFAHGDLSPDQLLHHDGDWTVLDVDRACRAPRGWDLACWEAALTATGTAGARPPATAPAVLVAAATLLRAPEPFRRRRPGWAAATRALVQRAAVAVDVAVDAAVGA